MRVTAIVANLVQMVIVLFIFLLQGISLGGATILALFFLLIIAGLNLVVLLFSMGSDLRGVVTEKKPVVKRQDLRVSYMAGAKSTLTVGGQQYHLLDFAESGARVIVGRHERLKKRSRCQINLLCGEKINTKVVVIRREGDEAALSFRPPVEYSVVLKEKQFVRA